MQKMWENDTYGYILKTVYAIAINFDDMLLEVRILQKKYDISTGVRNYLRYGINHSDPYYESKNNRWVINICSDDYICVEPYSEKCKYYLENSARYKG